MRTTLLILAMGIAGAAEQPKPTPADKTAKRINTAELVAFQAVEAELKTLRERFEAASKTRAQIQQDACTRLIGAPACKIDPQTGEASPEEKPAKKATKEEE
jgi:hypothetical protein